MAGFAGITRFLTAVLFPVFADGAQYRGIGFDWFRKRHRGSSPIRPETTWFNNGQFESKRFNLLRQRLAESFHSEFGGVITRKSRDAEPSSDRGNLNDMAKSLFPENRQHGTRDITHTPEVGIDLPLEFVGG